MDMEKIIQLEETGLVFNPYDEKMNEIPVDANAFPHRVGNLFKIGYSVNWEESGDSTDKNFTTQITMLHSYMTPFVSKNPGRAFLNYRDLDNGINHHNEIVMKKFRDYNFYRLVRIKTGRSRKLLHE